MQLFSADATLFSKKQLTLSFLHETTALKSCSIDPHFFFSAGAAAQTSPELIFHIMDTSKDSFVY